MEKLAGRLLPQAFSFEWTQLVLQRKRAGNTAAVVIDRGPGAEVRRALGIAVFFGMAGVTIVGLLLTPSCYVISCNLGDSVARRLRRQPPPAPQIPALAADRPPG